jgi:hypothetical protein
MPTISPNKKRDGSQSALSSSIFGSAKYRASFSNQFDFTPEIKGHYAHFLHLNLSKYLGPN